MHQLHRPQPLPNADQALFRLQQLEFAYPDGTRALQGIDLAITPGERIALVGHNGSGKTTLVKQLIGLLEPGKGELRYKGKSLSGEHLQQARLEIGLLFQDPDDQLFGHTLFDDVAFGPRNQGLSEAGVDQAVRQAVHDVGLEKLLHKPPHALSYGQKKRAALAGLLAMNPEVLILDEPTANLDPAQEQVFLDLLRDYPGTLICISHDLIFLYELCRRAVVLDQGTLHHDSSLQELVEHRPSLRDHGLDFSFRFADNRAIEPLTSAAEQSAVPAGAQAVAAKSDALIQLQGLHYRYPDGTRALNGIDLHIREGERIALVGENGAGKSTLLGGLFGILSTNGSYRFDGRKMTRRNRRQIWRCSGMVFQDCADQLVCPSCYDEVAFAPRQFGFSEFEIEQRVRKALAEVKLEQFAERVPLHLSGGERKRLALASVLSLKPRLLILDEPTAGLDPQGEELLLEILRGIDATILLVSHDMFFVRELTERTLVMHHGQLVRDYPTREFLTDSELTSLNGLDYTYRDRCSLEIRRLQHEHEHHHRHKHRHDHEHRHGELRHSHPHEHEHDHSHSFVHSHDQANRHNHPPKSEFHDHDHPDHHQDDHDHPH